MLRFLLALLLGLAVVVLDGGPARGVAAGLASVAEAAGDDCCPERPGAAPEEGDCCDVDFGRCCAPGVVALTPQSLVVRPVLYVAEPDAGPLSPPPLLPRSTGPPPIPPPLV